MKELANRYYIMMFHKNETKIFTDEEDFKKFLEEYSKVNRDTKNSFAYGNFKNINSEENSRVIRYSVYKKITKPNSLEIIDKYITDKCNDEKELKNKFSKEVENGNGKLYIGYMYKGQAKTLPIFYSKDKKYTDYKSLEELMIKNVLTPAFLSKIWTNPKLNSSEYRKKIEFYLERIQLSYGKFVMRQTIDINEIENSVKDFIKAWCTSKGYINQKYVRELGSIIKNILEAKEKKIIKKEKFDSEEEIKGLSESGKTRKKKRNSVNPDDYIKLF